MYFNMKHYLKSNRNHTDKQVLRIQQARSNPSYEGIFLKTATDAGC